MKAPEVHSASHQAADWDSIKAGEHAWLLGRSTDPKQQWNGPRMPSTFSANWRKEAASTYTPAGWVNSLAVLTSVQ